MVDHLFFNADVPPRKLSVSLPEQDFEEEEPSPESFDDYSGDEFRMYEFKVRRCMRGRSHDWTDCPFAHPGEKARRRDPRRCHYSGSLCPEFRRAGSCPRGDACEFAHGVFECWLHPARYRTMPCKDGRRCRRKVCFFAHSPRQLRLLPGSTGGCSTAAVASSPTSTLVGFASPPVSPPVSPYGFSNKGKRAKRGAAASYEAVVGELVRRIEEMQLSAAAVAASAGGGGGESSGGPDLDWVEELLM